MAAAPQRRRAVIVQQGPSVVRRTEARGPGHIRCARVRAGSGWEADRMHFHHFTVDVEEYFQVSAFEARLDRRLWGMMESRVADSVRGLLEMLDRYGARGTFFVLGWLADRKPEIVREIASAGHEIASHGWDHR